MATEPGYKSMTTFRPYITVTDEGKIDVDWYESFAGSENLTDNEVYDDDNDEHIKLMDSLVVGFTAAESLRNIANYIDKENK